MHCGGEGGAIDEEGILGILKEVVIRTEKDRFHGSIIGDHGQYDISLSGDLGKGGSVRASEFVGKGGCDFLIKVMDATDLVAFILEVTGHIRTHAADANEANFLF
jgi:hypothetical protein